MNRGAVSMTDWLEDHGIDTEPMTDHDLAAAIDDRHPGGIDSWTDTTQRRETP